MFLRFKILLYIGYPYTGIIIATGKPWYSKDFSKARFADRNKSLDFRMNTTQYELNQESAIDCWKQAQKCSSLRSREPSQSLPNTRSLAQCSVSFVPLLSGGMAANFVSNWRTEQECEKVTLKCKRSDGGLFRLHDTERKALSAVLCNVGRPGSLCPACAALVSGTKYPPPGDSKQGSLSTATVGKAFNTGFLLKSKKKTQIFSTLPFSEHGPALELPARCSAGDFRISFQYLLPLLRGRPGKDVEAKRWGRGYPGTGGAEGRVPRGHCPGTRGPYPFRSVPVGADGAERNPTPAAWAGRGAATAREEAAAWPCDCPVRGDTPSPGCGEGAPGRGRAGRGAALPCPLAERRGGKAASVRCRPAGAMRSCGRARGAAGWAAPLLLLWQWLPTVRPYNLDTQHALLFRGSNGTFFGYSVLLHRHGEERWWVPGPAAPAAARRALSRPRLLTLPSLPRRLVAGAPRASWPANESVVSPGDIFRCRIGGNSSGGCEQLQLGESAAGHGRWLGPEGRCPPLCAHRGSAPLPCGVCWALPA